MSEMRDRLGVIFGTSKRLHERVGVLFGVHGGQFYRWDKEGWPIAEQMVVECLEEAVKKRGVHRLPRMVRERLEEARAMQ